MLLSLIACSFNAVALDLHVGSWSGQAEYILKVGGEEFSPAHVVVSLSIRVDKNGKVVGSSPANGCKLLGLAQPGVSETVANVGFSLTSCNVPALNQRYQGTLAYYKTNKTMILSGGGSKVFPGKKPLSFSLRANLTR